MKFSFKKGIHMYVNDLHTVYTGWSSIFLKNVFNFRLYYNTVLYHYVRGEGGRFLFSCRDLYWYTLIILEKEIIRTKRNYTMASQVQSWTQRFSYISWLPSTDANSVLVRRDKQQRRPVRRLYHAHLPIASVETKTLISQKCSTNQKLWITYIEIWVDELFNLRIEPILKGRMKLIDSACNANSHHWLLHSIDQCCDACGAHMSRSSTHKWADECNIGAIVRRRRQINVFEDFECCSIGVIVVLQMITKRRVTLRRNKIEN